MLMLLLMTMMLHDQSIKPYRSMGWERIYNNNVKTNRLTEQLKTDKTKHQLVSHATKRSTMLFNKIIVVVFFSVAGAAGLNRVHSKRRQTYNSQTQHLFSPLLVASTERTFILTEIGSWVSWLVGCVCSFLLLVRCAVSGWLMGRSVVWSLGIFYCYSKNNFYYVCVITISCEVECLLVVFRRLLLFFY